MPELPEVQTVADNLAKKIVGKVFKAAEVKVFKMVNYGFKSKIKNQKVKKVFRRAKMIVIELTSNDSIIVHLKMTGQLIFVDKKGKAIGGGHPIQSNGIDLTKPNKYTHIILKFSDGSRLLFHDVRRFGWMRLVTDNEYSLISNQHGVEPLSSELSLSKFKEILVKRLKAKIKQLLLSQDLIVGIGNIYADESLFVAGINPLRQVKTLSQLEIKKLHQSIIKILKQAVKSGGTSVNTFVNSDGQRGKFVEKLKVYGRGGLKCFNCKSILIKTKLGGRGTVYCKKCQK